MEPTDEEREELLWEVAAAVEEPSPPVPDDAELAAYRAGTLPAAERRRVEALLGGSPPARARLAELAGIAAPPPEGGRRRLLATLPRQRGHWRRQSLPLAAGVALAFLGLWLAIRPQPAPPFARADAYRVTVEGLAELRSEGGSRDVLPETRVSLRIEPRGEATAGVEFAVYRRRGERLVRLPAAPPVSLEVSRGAAVLTAPAAALVGEEPGLHTLWVVAARPGDLPSALPAGEGDAEIAARLAGDGRRFSHAVHLRMRDGPTALEVEE